jgi:pyridoxine/pyridoxamine 5'-phosphate oxidase
LGQNDPTCNQHVFNNYSFFDSSHIIKLLIKILTMEKHMPLNQLNNLLKQEKKLGVNEPECAVLATVSAEG